MAVQIHNGDVVLATGDSVTAGGYPTVPGGLRDLINAQLYASYGAVAGPGNIRATVGVGNVPPVPVRTGIPRTPITMLNTAVPGITSTYVLANLSEMITSQNPDVLFLLIGTNEHLPPANPSYSYAQSQANLEAIVDQARAALPNLRIVLLSLLTFDEQWTAGSPPAWNPVDVETDTRCGIIQTVAAEKGCEFVDLRNPMLVQESLLNTPAPGATSGVLTSDGRHPNTAGQLFMGNTIVPHLLMVP